MLASSRTPRRRKHTGWAAASGGGISGRGNPSDRAWRRGHLPLTREANCGAGLVANRETMILMLLRTRVGADSISARSSVPQTSAGGYGIRPYMGFPRYPAAPGCGFSLEIAPHLEAVFLFGFLHDELFVVEIKVHAAAQLQVAGQAQQGVDALSARPWCRTGSWRPPFWRGRCGRCGGCSARFLPARRS